MNLCSGCKEDFGSVSTFDAHRVGRYNPNNRHCLDQEEMLARHWRQDSRGRWRRPVDRTAALSIRQSPGRSRVPRSA
jgi:hypothetical protein